MLVSAGLEERKELYRAPAKMRGCLTAERHITALSCMILVKTVKTNMQAAGVSKVFRDLILGHSLQAMDKYTRWLDDQIAKTVASVDQAGI